MSIEKCHLTALCFIDHFGKQSKFAIDRWMDLWQSLDMTDKQTIAQALKRFKERSIRMVEPKGTTIPTRTRTRKVSLELTELDMLWLLSMGIRG